MMHQVCFLSIDFADLFRRMVWQRCSAWPMFWWMNHSLFSISACKITRWCIDVEQTSLWCVVRFSLLRVFVRSHVHFETVLLFVRSDIAIRLSISDAEQFVSVVFLSCWAKRRLSMAWRFNQLDANRDNRFNRGITFDGGGRFMHRCQFCFCQGLIVWCSCTSPRRVKMQGLPNFCMSWCRGFSCHFNSDCCGGALLFII